MDLRGKLGTTLSLRQLLISHAYVVINGHKTAWLVVMKGGEGDIDGGREAENRKRKDSPQSYLLFFFSAAFLPPPFFFF